jgi:hypothetical protein
MARGNPWRIGVVDLEGEQIHCSLRGCRVEDVVDRTVLGEEHGQLS